MTRTWLGAATLAFCVACDTNQIPTHPSPQSASSPTVPSGPVRQRIVLGEAMDVDLVTTVNNGTYCEVREDPAPCAWFDVAVLRSGTLSVRLDFEPIDPMFLDLHQSGSPPRTGFNATSIESPFVVRQAVAPGLVEITAGLYRPWGRPGTMRFRLLATLE